ncbi:MAG: hypothetical protein IBJ03_15035 [Gemmatimonadaceae bacterium]|nr:hypothetical protein [Gemmatimonadaceae bacterium]
MILCEMQVLVGSVPVSRSVQLDPQARFPDRDPKDNLWTAKAAEKAAEKPATR